MSPRTLNPYWLSFSMCNVQCFSMNCFNLVDTCNIALILFLKCDFTKFRIPPCHTSHFVDPPPLRPLNVWRSIWMSPKPTGERLLGRPRHRWKYNIRMQLKQMISIRRIRVLRLRIWRSWEFGIESPGSIRHGVQFLTYNSNNLNCKYYGTLMFNVASKRAPYSVPNWAAMLGMIIYLTVVIIISVATIIKTVIAETTIVVRTIIDTRND